MLQHNTNTPLCQLFNVPFCSQYLGFTSLHVLCPPGEPSVTTLCPTRCSQASSPSSQPSLRPRAHSDLYFMNSYHNFIEQHLNTWHLDNEYFLTFKIKEETKKCKFKAIKELFTVLFGGLYRAFYTFISVFRARSSVMLTTFWPSDIFSYKSN